MNSRIVFCVLLVRFLSPVQRMHIYQEIGEIPDTPAVGRIFFRIAERIPPGCRFSLLLQVSRQLVEPDDHSVVLHRAELYKFELFSVFSDPRLVVQPSLIFNCLFVYPYAFIHSTWAFPLMACYLNWTLEQIAENGAGRLGDYLSGREYRSRQLENEESN